MRSFTREAAKKKFRIGVIGYSAAYFDRAEATKLLKKILSKALRRNKEKASVAIVSGLTNMGIPAIAYNLAKEKNYYTIGYACEKANEFTLFPVDKKYIIGKNWGDESESFLDNIDVLIAIGGGDQTKEELKKAEEKQIPIYYEELPKKVSYCLMGFLDTHSAKELYEEASKLKAKDIKKYNSYHVTIRFWLKDPSDKRHLQRVKSYLNKRFKNPIQLAVNYDGTTEVLGDESAYTLLVESPILRELQAELDKKLQSLGAPPSDYPTYKAHITVAEGVTKQKKITPKTFYITNWKLTSCTDCTSDSEVLWETDFPLKKVTAKKIILSEADFIGELQRAKNFEEVADFLIFKTSQHTTDAAVFDHFLLLFFSLLPDFDQRHDFDEYEVEAFKSDFPYERYCLNREALQKKLSDRRSVNRIIDEIIEELTEEQKVEIAREHLYNFWFKEKCNSNLEKFLKLLKPTYWLRS